MKKVANIKARTDNVKIRSILKEIFDSDAEITWNNSSTERLGYFSIADTKYQMKIQKDSEKIEGNDIYMFKFSWWDGREWQKSFTKKQNAFSVFGVLRKGVLSFIKEVKPAIFFFVGDSKRHNVYSKLLDELSRINAKEYGSIDGRDIAKEYVYILIRKDLTDTAVNKIKDYIKRTNE